ncbi:Cd2+/Zn2+-exporting ATPase/Cu+-exporting ATPase [Deinobacterium chartae]|uniref:Cd2+/Zn2+-exporting ATPase/Cu+-exporting ATPase n=1 Tax=Deinobacterium chartae TaxID=521158 RepID=A0A841I3E4_9DEIO|nr:cation-translocating P-type ATPase [Deinobacterium chartae]MBB6098888.1 Cd2+/Zn2+-exporting ATPase/Cu+-exporting ATPase [Deinobacterium chartae]
MTRPAPTTLEVPVQGMDCANCARHVQEAIGSLPGVQSVEVLLGAERAVVQLDPARTDLAAIRRAVQGAGYIVPADTDTASATDPARLSHSLLGFLGLLLGLIVLVIVAGEWLGLLDALTGRIPTWASLALTLIIAYPILISVARAALRRRITSHTLMTVGLIAAALVGEWATAMVVAFFMRLGDLTEKFTAERSRRALRDLAALAPRLARLEQDGQELEVGVERLRPGSTVVVRPGERIPADGEVLSGQATVNQASITGESMPVEVGPGSRVFAATLAELGSLRVRVERIGDETAFGRAVRLVAEAEANRGPVQSLADRFSALYLPVVGAVALLTYLLSGNALATTAVLVVACSCSFALATPVAMLASIGAAARRGLLIKGGRYLEALPRTDVLLIDKTGTLTRGRPEITDVLPLGERTENELLALAAAAEHDSEHPLATAVRRAARARGLEVARPESFRALPGQGVTATVAGHRVEVGRLPEHAPLEDHPQVRALREAGRTALLIRIDGTAAGVLGALDTLRPGVAEAITELRRLGVRHLEVLTGDHPAAARALAEPLGLAYRANLLPEDKIAVVREYQRQGRRVAMLGDGVNDAPALAQADVGLAMASGADIASEAAHIALLREDWQLVPEAWRIARRTLGVVRFNLGFTAVYNVAGLALAAFGFLPPLLAAALQSLPDLGILANSSRLIRER